MHGEHAGSPRNIRGNEKDAGPRSHQSPDLGREGLEKGSSPRRECAEVYGRGVDTPSTPEQVSPAPEGLCPL